MRHLRKMQETACLKYVELGNATQAMIQAGYSPKYAFSNTTHVFDKPWMQARIKELRQKIEDESVMNALERRQKLSEIARAVIPDFVGDDGIKVTKDIPNVAAVEEITTKTKFYRKGGEPVIITNLKLHSPISAIQELNKMDKLYSDGHVFNLNQNIQNVEARIVNFNAGAVAKAILEAAKLGLIPAVFGGNGHGEGADVLSSSTNIQATAIPEPKD